MDGDGDADATDKGTINIWWAFSIYDVRGDLDLDGDVDADDYDGLTESLSDGVDVLSQALNALGSQALFASLRSSYSVHRLRLLQPDTWSSRDPMRYVDGTHLFAVLNGNSLAFVDRSGTTTQIGFCGGAKHVFRWFVPNLCAGRGRMVAVMRTDVRESVFGCSWASTFAPPLRFNGFYEYVEGNGLGGLSVTDTHESRRRPDTFGSGWLFKNLRVYCTGDVEGLEDIKNRACENPSKPPGVDRVAVCSSYDPNEPNPKFWNNARPRAEVLWGFDWWWNCCQQTGYTQTLLAGPFVILGPPVQSDGGVGIRLSGNSLSFIASVH